MATSWTYPTSPARLGLGGRLFAMASLSWLALRRLTQAAAQHRDGERAQRDGKRVRALAEQLRRSHPGMAADLDAAVDRLEDRRHTA